MNNTHNIKRDEMDRDNSGRYSKGPVCDCCNKPAGLDSMTDGDVCGLTDGPGFVICERKRCAKFWNTHTVEERRAHYTAMRDARVSK